MNSSINLRILPAVDDVLHAAKHDHELGVIARPQLVRWIRSAIDDFRQRILSGEQFDGAELLRLVLEQVRTLRHIDNSRAAQPVINATGVLLHTNLGRAPLALKAIERMQAAYGYTNLETDLESGKRNRRGERVASLLAELTGAEDAVVVNNCAGATMLVLQAIAGGREVIVSRGQLIEIGGGFRLPEVFTSAGVTLREVGTTNRTYLHDYERAINEQTGAMIRVHRSNFQQTGFIAEPTIDELVGAERPNGIPVIDDVGSGCVVDLSEFGISEPTVQASVACGADLCLFSGDKLFGGPQSGIVVGKRKWIEQLLRNPMMRAMRPDKTTLAALEATTEIHLAGNALAEIPFYQMLATPANEIRERCDTLRKSLVSATGLPTAADIETIECQSQVGGGSLPGVELPSWGVSMRTSSTETLARKLRRSQPAVQCRQSDDRLLLDLRTVFPEQLPGVQSSLQAALQSGDATDAKHA